MSAFDRRELLLHGGRLTAAGVAVGLGLPSWASGATPKQLNELEQALAGPLLRPGDAVFATARRPWNARYDRVAPQAVARPLRAADVKTIVSWAVKHDVRLAIRSGGHSYAGLSSTTGVVVDLSRLSTISLHGDGTATIGAGAGLGRVYARLWQAGHRTIPVGSCPTVGIGGLTLGGGHGFCSRAFGLACDALTSVDIVTADGALRHCSAAHEADLFWALRGGGAGSYGIVTRMTFATRPVGRVTTFSIEWPWAAAAEVVPAWDTFMHGAPDTLSSVLALRVPQTTGGEPKLAANGQFLGSKPAAAGVLAALVGAMPAPVNVTLVERPFDRAAVYFAGGQTERRRIAGASHVARKPIAARGLVALVEAVEARHADPRLRGGGIVLFAFGGAINRVGRRQTAFVHRDARFSMQLVALWSQPGAELESAELAWLVAARRSLRPFVSDEAIQNYADAQLAGWKRAYYAENLERLVKVKKAVDPANRFRHAQSIPTML